MNRKTLFLILCFAPAVFAGQTRVGRYITAQDKPALSQTNPLEQTISLTFPAEILTIGDAVNYLLDNTGYQIVPKKYRTRNAAELLRQKLPLSNRTFQAVTVKTALLAISGGAYFLLADPKHRYVSFALKPKFSKLY